MEDLINNILNCDYNANKITIKNMTFKTINIKKNQLFDAITKLILDKVNLFYYLTQKMSTKTLEATKDHIKELIKSNTLDLNINDIFNNIGWNSDSLDVSDTTFQGDLSEYLMCILIDNFRISETLISKVSLKTSPKMSSYGNDNIFYDYNNKVLYYGESKFYSNTGKALESALNSILIHTKDLTELSYIRQHSTVIIAENGEKIESISSKLENVANDEFKINAIIFIMSDDIFEDNNYIEILNNYLSKIEYNIETIFVFLPIISKSEFLEYFKSELKKYE